MYRSILVPLDGSKFGEHALPWALKIARRAGATLHLAHVHVPQAVAFGDRTFAYVNSFDEALQESERAYLDQIIQRLRGIIDVPVSSSLVQGPIADALEGQAEAVDADLVVMTTHGRGTMARSWLGSVADELVRRTPRPIVLVRPHEARLDLAEEPPLQHILIPLDGSPFAEQVLEPTLALGTLMGCAYTLVQAIPPAVLGGHVPPNELGLGPGHVLFEQLQQRHQADRERAEHYLNQVAERLRARSLRVRTHVLVHEQPAVALVQEVKDRRVDLVAIATHGRSGLARLFLGSVADKVLRGTAVPVLVHRPQGK